MDTEDYFQCSVTEQSYEFAVWEQGDSSYDSEMTDTGQTVQMAVSDVNSQFSVTTEGADQDVSYRGLIEPTYSDDGSIESVVDVTDELRRVNGQQRYVVETKSGRPNDIDPELWEVGLRRANQSG